MSTATFFPETHRGALELHRLVQPGLRVNRLVELASKLDLAVEDLARRCGLTRPALQRRKADHKPLSASETDLLLRYALLFKQAVTAFEDEREARAWLKSPQYGLNGAVPLDLASTTVGYREVEKLLTRLDYGVYA